MSSSVDRPRLTRDRVVAEAIALADEQGLDAVSMRSLAVRLGVVPMALYKHVPDKEGLVAAMIDAVVAGFPAVAQPQPWRDALRTRIRHARQALGRHGWLQGAIEAAPQPTPAVLAHLDAATGDFLAAGFSVDLTHYAMHALGSRVWGFSPEAFTGRAPAEALDEQSARAAAERFPHIAAVAADAAMRHASGACEPDGEFDFTLDLILDAVARLHDDGWTSRP